jgi:hypothetical protein
MPKKLIIYFTLPNITYWEKLIFVVKNEKIGIAYLLGKTINNKEEVFFKSENSRIIDWEKEFPLPVYRATTNFK